jgi:hypothetical protein
VSEASGPESPRASNLFVIPYRLVLASLLASFTLGCSPCAAESPTPRIPDPIYVRAQRLVEIEPGRKVNIYCTGSGSPTVVFDSGLTDATSV